MRIRLRRLLVTVAMLAGFVLPTSSAAQGAGRITGRVVDAESGRPLVGAQVGIEGSSVGTLSGVDGRFKHVLRSKHIRANSFHRVKLA